MIKIFKKIDFEKASQNKQQYLVKIIDSFVKIFRKNLQLFSHKKCMYLFKSLLS